MATNNNTNKPTTKSPDKIWSYNIPVGIDETPEVQSLWRSIVRLCGGKTDSTKTRNMWDRVMRMLYTLFALCAVCYDRISNPCGDLILPGRVMDSADICDWICNKMYRYVSTSDIKSVSILFDEMLSCKIVQPANDGTESLCVPMWQQAQRFMQDNMRRQKQENDAWRQYRINKIVGNPSKKQEDGYRGYYRISHELDITDKNELNTLLDWALDMACVEGRSPSADQWVYFRNTAEYYKLADKNASLPDLIGDGDRVKGDGDGECYGDEND